MSSSHERKIFRPYGRGALKKWVNASFPKKHQQKMGELIVRPFSQPTFG
jgi:hypothetical protein